MRILLDHCLDVRFAKFLPDHEVVSTKAMGWEDLSNGMLLSVAEREGFEVFLTVDKNLRFQQNLSSVNLVVITMATRFTAIEDLEALVPQLRDLLGSSPASGAYVLKA